MVVRRGGIRAANTYLVHRGASQEMGKLNCPAAIHRGGAAGSQLQHHDAIGPERHLPGEGFPGDQLRHGALHVDLGGGL